MKSEEGSVVHLPDSARKPEHSEHYRRRTTCHFFGLLPSNLPSTLLSSSLALLLRSGTTSLHKSLELKIVTLQTSCSALIHNHVIILFHSQPKIPCKRTHQTHHLAPSLKSFIHPAQLSSHLFPHLPRRYKISCLPRLRP